MIIELVDSAVEITGGKFFSFNVWRIVVWLLVVRSDAEVGLCYLVGMVLV